MYSQGYGRELHSGSKYKAMTGHATGTESFLHKFTTGFVGLTEEQKDFIGGIGCLTTEEAESVNRCFPAFLFYERTKSGMECTCSACHRRFTVRRYGEWPYEPSEAEYALLNLRHNDMGRCPYCDQSVTLKSAGVGRKSWGFICDRFVIFRGAGDDVTAFTVWAKKEFQYDDDPPIEYFIDRYIWRFRPGKAECFAGQRGSYANLTWRKTKRPVNPWPNPSYMQPDTSWWALNEDNVICRSFLGYTETAGRNNDRLRYYYAYAENPKCEMLDKAGLTKVVDEIAKGKTLGKIVDWKQRKPLAAFGLTKPELEEWTREAGDPGILKIFKDMARSGKPVTMEEAVFLRYNQRLIPWLDKLGVRPQRIKNYLAKQNKDYLYHDYLKMSEGLGYDLTQEIVAFPKNLQAAHDRAADAERAILREKQEREEAEARKAFEKNYKELEKKYAFVWGDYFIRPANSAAEIIAEGAAMKNCIAGYANRHIQGKLCICFLRRIAEPEKPYVDIEMDGEFMKQCHGYRNDYDTKHPARELHAEMLDAWLAWIKGGSKRDKNGKPKIKIQKQKENVA